MSIRTWGRAALMALVLVAPAAAQDRGPHRDRHRSRLEEQIRTRFLTAVVQRLDLSGDQRAAVVEIMDEGAAARRALAEESRSLRDALMTAVRNEDTPQERYADLLARMRAIRDREHQLMLEEEARLGDVLDPRQQALFLFMRMRFNEQVRGMRGPPGHGPGPRGGGR